MRRASILTKQMSSTLRQAIDTMINLYVANIFVERPIWRIMFGPKYLLNQWQRNFEDQKKNDAEEITLTKQYDQPGNSQQFSSKKNFRIKNNISDDTMLIDETVREILKIYDEIQPNLKRLGVDINPRKLIQNKYRYQYSVDNRRLDLVEKNEQKQIELENYWQNSIWSLFVNNSVNAFDLYTGSGTFKNGEIIRWNSKFHMDVWFGRSCNTINGTDGKQFTPFLQKSRIYRFIPRICR